MKNLVTVLLLSLTFAACKGPFGEKASDLALGVSASEPVCVGASCNVKLEWDANASEDDVTGYRVYWDTQSGGRSAHADVSAATTYTIEGLAPGNYYISISAINAQGESDPSDELAVEVGS